MEKKRSLTAWLGMGLLSLGFGCAPPPTTATLETDTGTATSTTVIPQAARVEAPVAYEPYAGKYEMQQSEIREVTISLENGKLHAQAGSMPRTELIPTTTADQFTVPNSNVRIIFTREGQPGVTGMQVLYEGQTYTGRKVQ